MKKENSVSPGPREGRNVGCEHYRKGCSGLTSAAGVSYSFY